MNCRVFLFILLMILQFSGLSQVYEIQTGNLSFSSDSRQELIKASSDSLKGFLDIEKRIFAMRLAIASFRGFNSALQKEHFNENYMETQKYPYAYFSGKIIEDVDLSADGEYFVRAKGKLIIHGVEHERIVYARLSSKQGEMQLHSDFTVSLEDHKIKVPRVVSEKLATNINIAIHAKLVKK